MAGTSYPAPGAASLIAAIRDAARPGVPGHDIE